MLQHAAALHDAEALVAAREDLVVLDDERRLLLADEPTGALDSVTSRQLFELLRDLSEAGNTVVMVTHDLTGGRYASRTLHMTDGRLAGSDHHTVR